MSEEDRAPSNQEKTSLATFVGLRSTWGKKEIDLKNAKRRVSFQNLATFKATIANFLDDRRRIVHRKLDLTASQSAIDKFNQPHLLLFI